MDNERMKILEMLQEGKINAEQASALLEALGGGEQAAGPRPEPEKARPGPAMDWGQFGRGLAQRIQGDLARAFGGVSAPGGRAARSNYSKVRLTRSYLSRMEDDTVFTNYGKAFIADDVPEELLSTKIGEYHNFGRTVGPPGLLTVLEERCESNFGAFDETEGGEQPSRTGDSKASRESAEAPRGVVLTSLEVAGWCRELAVTCHSGDLELIGSDEDALVLSGRRHGDEGGAGEGDWDEPMRAVPWADSRDDTRLSLSLGSEDDPSASEHVIFRVEIPEGIAVRAAAGRGDISARSIPSSLELTTGEGDISCRDIAGDIRVSTSGGDANVSDVAGEAVLETASGDAVAKDVAGAVTARTGGGDAEIGDIAGGVTVETAGGDAVISDVAGGVDVKTGGGDVKLSDIAGGVTADTAGGDLVADDIAGSVSADVGGGQARVSDVSGAVTIEKEGG